MVDILSPRKHGYNCLGNVSHSPVRMLRIKKTQNIAGWRDVGRKKPVLATGGSVTLCILYGKENKNFHPNTNRTAIEPGYSRLGYALRRFEHPGLSLHYSQEPGNRSSFDVCQPTNEKRKCGTFPPHNGILFLLFYHSKRHESMSFARKQIKLLSLRQVQ